MWHGLFNNNQPRGAINSVSCLEGLITLLTEVFRKIKNNMGIVIDTLSDTSSTCLPSRENSFSSLNSFSSSPSSSPSPSDLIHPQEKTYPHH